LTPLAKNCANLGYFSFTVKHNKLCLAKNVRIPQSIKYYFIPGKKNSPRNNARAVGKSVLPKNGF